MNFIQYFSFIKDLENYPGDDSESSIYNLKIGLFSCTMYRNFAKAWQADIFLPSDFDVEDEDLKYIFDCDTSTIDKYQNIVTINCCGPNDWDQVKFMADPEGKDYTIGVYRDYNYIVTKASTACIIMQNIYRRQKQKIDDTIAISMRLNFCVINQYQYFDEMYPGVSEWLSRQ